MTGAISEHSAVPLSTESPVLSHNVLFIVEAVPIYSYPAAIGKDAGVQTAGCEWRQCFDVPERVTLPKAACRSSFEAIPVGVAIKRKVRPNYEQNNGGQDSNCAQAGDESFFPVDMVFNPQGI